MGLPASGVLLTFMIASLTTLLVPGPAVLYVVTRSVEYGRGGAVWSVLGVETGAAVHALTAAAGVAAVLQSSPTALVAVRWLGVGYLLWLAILQFVRSSQPMVETDTEVPARGRFSLYRDGLLVDLLNPKTALFFLAFVPQFVDPTRGSPAVQSGLLGLLFVGLALVCDGGYALAASRLAGHWTSARFQLVTRRLTGIVYLTLAGVAAFA